MAMVATGPIPGKTPINVPSRHPTRQKNRFCRLAAAVKPTIRLPKMSILAASEYGDRLAQSVDEDENAEDRETDAERDGLFPFHLRRGEGAEHGDDEDGRSQAGGADQECEQQDADQDQYARIPQAALDRRPVHGHGAQPDHPAEEDEADAQQHRHVARSHLRDRAHLVVAAEPEAATTRWARSRRWDRATCRCC